MLILSEFVRHPVFNTTISSDGVSTLDLEASSDSGVGGGDAGGYKCTAKSFDLSKIRAKYLKIWKNIPQHLGTDVSTPLFSLCDE